MHDLLLMIYWELLPTVLQVIGAILGVLLMRAANTARTRWGIEIEARHREALQSALMTGITAALSRGLSGKAAVAAAIEHAAKAGAPDAIEFFGLDLDDLERIAESKLHLQWPPVIGVDYGRPAETGSKGGMAE